VNHLLVLGLKKSSTKLLANISRSRP